MNPTGCKSPHKPTLTAGLSCLSATSNCMHALRPLCYRQHTATGDVHKICGSWCWRYWCLSSLS